VSGFSKLGGAGDGNRTHVRSLGTHDPANNPPLEAVENYIKRSRDKAPTALRVLLQELEPVQDKCSLGACNIKMVDSEDFKVTESVP